MSAPVLFKKPTPSQINLIKNGENHFLLLKILKKYLKCPTPGNKLHHRKSFQKLLEDNHLA